MATGRARGIGSVGHKFNAVPTECDGYRFDSKAEARYYLDLVKKREMGVVVFFLRQVPFHLPGAVIYRCDFMEFWPDGTVHIVDVKGMRTKQYISKKKQVEALYPVLIEEKKA